MTSEAPEGTSGAEGLPDARGASSPEVSRFAVIRGAYWSTVQTVASKVASLLAMWLLAFLLPPEQYGVSSVAVTLGVSLIIIPPFAMTDVLVSRSSDFRVLRRSATLTALSAGIAVALLILAAAAVSWIAFARHELAWLLACVALRPVGDALMIVPMSQLRIQLRYRELSIADTCCNFASTLLGIGLALAGAGGISIVLPPIAATFMRWVWYRSLVGADAPGPLGPSGTSSRDLGAEHGVRRQFLVAASGQYVSNVVVVTEPLALAAFASATAQGFFALASQIASQTNFLLASQLGMVLQPALAKLNGTEERQSHALCRAVFGIALVSVPASVMQVALAAPAFEAFLGEKWAFAIGPFMALSVAQVGVCLAIPTQGLLKAQGRFWAILLWQVLQAVASLALYSLALGSGQSGLCDLVQGWGIPCAPESSECLVVACGSAVVWSLSAPAGLLLTLNRRVPDVLALLWQLTGLVAVSSAVGLAVHAAMGALRSPGCPGTWRQAVMVLVAGALGWGVSVALGAACTRQGRELCGPAIRAMTNRLRFIRPR